MKTFTIAFTRRQVALMLSVILIAASFERLAILTNTAAHDLRRIADGKRAPTPGVLSYLGIRRSGRKFVWQF